MARRGRGKLWLLTTAVALFGCCAGFFLFGSATLGATRAAAGRTSARGASWVRHGLQVPRLFASSASGVTKPIKAAEALRRAGMREGGSAGGQQGVVLGTHEQHEQQQGQQQQGQQGQQPQQPRAEQQAEQQQAGALLMNKEVKPNTRVALTGGAQTLGDKTLATKWYFPPETKRARSPPPPMAAYTGDATKAHKHIPALEAALEALPGGRERFVSVGFATEAHAEFARNWAATQAAVGLHPLLFAMDAGMDTYCKRHGMLCFPEHSMDNSIRSMGDFEGVVTGGVGLGGEKQHDFGKHAGLAFQTLGARKAYLLLAVVELDYAVLVSDADTAWMRDPSPYFMSEEVARADYWTATDCLSVQRERTAGGCIQLSENLNTGIMFVRPTAVSKKLLAQWLHETVVVEDANLHDQHIFNFIIKRGIAGFEHLEPRDGLDSAAGTRVFKVAKGFGAMGLLDNARFASGNVYFVQHLPEKLDAKPYAVHTTYQFNGVQGKRHRLREAGLWVVDDDAYYGADGTNFLALRLWDEADGRTPDAVADRDCLHFARSAAKLDDPAADVSQITSCQQIDRHLSLAAYQRESVRNAQVIAEALNRTLVLPQLTCFCERYMGRTLPSCIIEGQDLPAGRPVIDPCPMDYLFYMPNWFTAKAPFREHSFFSSPRIPAPLVASRREVVVGDAAAAGNSGAAVLPPAPTDEDVRRVLGGLGAVRVLELKQPFRSLCTLRDDSAARKVDARMKHVIHSEVRWCDALKGGVMPCRWGYETPTPLAGRTPEQCNAA